VQQLFKHLGVIHKMVIYHDTFETVNDGDGLKDGWFNGSYNFFPIGAIIPWAKHLEGVSGTSLNSHWAECNGQTISDSDSPLSGTTLPNLNGENRFLRGNSITGGTGGSETYNFSETHFHHWIYPNGAFANTFQSGGAPGQGFGAVSEFDDGGGTGDHYIDIGGSSVSNGYTDNKTISDTIDTLPPYYSVTWIMRIK